MQVVLDNIKHYQALEAYGGINVVVLSLSLANRTNWKWNI